MTSERVLQLIADKADKMADNTLIQLAIGPRFLTDSSVVTGLRAGKTGELMTADCHGRWHEPASRDKLFMAAHQSFAAATQAGLSLTNPAFTLYNPSGSQVNLVLAFAGVTMVVAQATNPAAFVLAANTNPAAAAPATVTGGTIRCARLGSSAVPQGAVYTACTLPAAPVAVAVLGGVTLAAMTTAPNAPQFGRWFDGSVVIIPGCAVSIQTLGATGTPASSCYMEFVWEEVPIQ